MPDVSVRDPELSERVKREKESYNTGLRRGRYNDVLSHTDHLYSDKRFRLAGELIRAHGAGTVLELGCKTWPHFLGRNGIGPQELTCINISEAELDEGRAMVGAGPLRPRFCSWTRTRSSFPTGISTSSSAAASCTTSTSGRR